MHVSDPTPVKTVLIIEDDADIAEVLTIFLHEATPYQAIHASNGFAALKIVQTITHNSSCSIIVCRAWMAWNV